MFYIKQGFPEEDEFVLCTVTNIQHHSVFVKLKEYDKSGMIHISEVSPGRIRNIRDYVKEGKVVVCKVLRINIERGHIDLSLRRVTEGQKRNKTDEIKHEQKAEKIVEFVAKNLKIDVKKLYDEITEKIFKKYEMLYPCFEEVITNEGLLKELGFKGKLEKELLEVIKQRIKPPEVLIGGKFTLTSFESNGIEIIKDALKRALNVDKENITISYMGGGNYKIAVKAGDYKTAEKILEDSTKIVLDSIEQNKGIAEFIREEK
ncbi:translation initiation factor IF-2 subunit alpha [Candidatus Woesearchaeota archaeon]|nr:translation initiation factor IF-2 subunit alpha [Candidatus Woesearchaeota archaeon]